MSKTIIDFIKIAESAQKVSELDTYFCKTLQSLACERFTYTYYDINFTQNQRIQHELPSPFLQQWHQHFVKNSYEFIDPIGERVKKSIVPVSWTLEDELNHAHGQQTKLFSEALDYGLRSGISIPYHDYNNEKAILVVHNQDIKNLIAKNIELPITLYQVGLYYHQNVVRLIHNNQQTPEIHLTKREKQCLILTAQNKTVDEIADQLNITNRTVGFHIEHANHKLGTRNKYQSVAKAIQLKLITL